jgi:hypothetical protein
MELWIVPPLVQDLAALRPPHERVQALPSFAQNGSSSPVTIRLPLLDASGTGATAVVSNNEPAAGASAGQEAADSIANPPCSKGILRGF